MKKACRSKPLGGYSNQDLVLTLPSGKTLRDIKWLAVWCRKFSANFGDLLLPRNLEIPRPVEVGPLPTLDHGVSSGNIKILDSQTLLVPDFHYDGEGPAAYWWASRGPRQSPRGFRLPDEHGSYKPLPIYMGKTVTIRFPEEKTIYDFDWVGVWCEEARVDFGSIRIPHNVKVPPSRQLLGAKAESKVNCEVLSDDLGLEVRWVLEGNEIITQLVGKLEKNEYVAFGLSKDDTRTNMVNADAVVGWLDGRGRGHAVDYFLSGKEQCVGERGSCPDIRYLGAEDSITLLNAAVVNGFTMITYRRPLVALDAYDQHVYLDGPQAVMWAVGPINNRGEVSYHRLKTKGDMFLDFNRKPNRNCPTPDDPPRNAQSSSGSSSHSNSGTSSSQYQPMRLNTPSSSSDNGGGGSVSDTASDIDIRRQGSAASPARWEIPAITCPPSRTFHAQIGPTGGKRGYQAITGQVGWGIAWYIDGLLIPELTVERGTTYTFVVEGGNDPENPAKNHPLYITNSPEGGYEYKTSRERRRERLYAGVGRSRQGPFPMAAGRLCEFVTSSRSQNADIFPSFVDFQRTLTLKCQPGEPAVLEWTPDEKTPDLVYYQCYTHRFLGWKIHVVDSCSEYTASSIRHVVNISAADLQLTKPIVKKQPFDYMKPPPAHDHPEDHWDILSLNETNEGADDDIGLSRRESITDVQDSNREQELAEEEEADTEEEDDGGIPLPSDHGSVPVVVYRPPPPRPNKSRVPSPIRNPDLVMSHAIRPPDQYLRPPLLANPLHKVHFPLLHYGEVVHRRRPLPSPVQFESGFVPIVVRAEMGERMPDPTTPPPGQRPPLPFHANNSVPFHASFKPGKPDFSGFGISNNIKGERPLRFPPPVPPPLHQPPSALDSRPPPQILEHPEEDEFPPPNDEYSDDFQDEVERPLLEDGEPAPVYIRGDPKETTTEPQETTTSQNEPLVPRRNDSSNLSPPTFLLQQLSPMQDNSNGSHYNILSHVLSLIAEGTVPPDVLGIAPRVHVERRDADHHPDHKHEHDSHKMTTSLPDKNKASKEVNLASKQMEPRLLSVLSAAIFLSCSFAVW